MPTKRKLKKRGGTPIRYMINVTPVAPPGKPIVGTQSNPIVGTQSNLPVATPVANPMSIANTISSVNPSQIKQAMNLFKQTGQPQLSSTNMEVKNSLVETAEIASDGAQAQVKPVVASDRAQAEVAPSEVAPSVGESVVSQAPVNGAQANGAEGAQAVAIGGYHLKKKRRKSKKNVSRNGRKSKKYRKNKSKRR